MKIITSVEKMQVYARVLRKNGSSIGFVPTMGYLHDGHVALVQAAKKQNDIVILSIFVNPIQFGPNEDFDKYPRDIERDEKIAKNAGVDIIFYPEKNDMYRENFSTYVNVEHLTDNLCGAKRPGHFRGVTTVVAKLFNIVKPDMAYFGQKDIQQAIVIKKMAEDLNMDIAIRIMPTVREKDGLAMSSRNVYLTEGQREEALVINRALSVALKLFKEGERSASKIINKIEGLIKDRREVTIDYIKIVDDKMLKDITKIKSTAILAIACFVGKTRLIDNVILE